MNLFDQVKEKETEDKQDLIEQINRKRRQILVHSYIYYRLNTSIISDYKFDNWCKELVELQNNHPQLVDKCVFAGAFEGFEGVTGAFLPLGDHWVSNAAHKLLKNPLVKDLRVKGGY